MTSTINYNKQDVTDGKVSVDEIEGIEFIDYHDESQIDAVMSLVGRDLSEPYSIFTYRFFLHRFPELCILAVSKDHPTEPIACVVGKIDLEDLYVNGNVHNIKSGYIGMLAVDQRYRRLGIGSSLVKRVIMRMKEHGCSSVTLETEVSNKAAQRLYQEAFGFIREELLVRYYLNWGDAYRLRLWLA
mmetsp:Transcript_7783/g.14168  ORF Transcript_7783/g.14168 Transcript_7783/m.14168 type:complete len:186 (+) Transcript_7783:44-601(+)